MALFSISIWHNFQLVHTPSLGIKGKNTPAYCCPAGLKKMAKEFHQYSEQYKVNLKSLMKADDEILTGVLLLKEEYEKL